MSLLERAIEIAVSAHKEQVDKASKPYILHPLRLMFEMRSENEMIAAVLHDAMKQGSHQSSAVNGRLSKHK